MCDPVCMSVRRGMEEEERERGGERSSVDHIDNWGCSTSTWLLLAQRLDPETGENRQRETRESAQVYEEAMQTPPRQCLVMKQG